MEQTTAFGAAMYGMIAAGSRRGGYDSFEEMEASLNIAMPRTFYPGKRNHGIYNDLFVIYQRLVDYFGILNRDIMEALKKMRTKRYG